MTVGVDTPNTLMTVFSDTVTAGFAALQGPVNSVFGLMITLVVALTGIQWALSPQREILAAGFGKVLLVGAFAWLINDWQALSETLYAGFIELGLTAGGGDLAREDFLNPGAVLAQGWTIVKALGDTPAPVANPLDVVGNLTDALILGLAMIGILLAFAVLALQIIVALLEFKIVTLGGFVLLPFGIWNRTAFLAERPLGYVVSAGLKVLALAVVVSGAQSIFDQLQPSTNPDIYEALSILVAAILLAMLAVFIPNLASALVTGGPALGAGSVLAGGLAVAGAGLAAGAGAVAAGAALGGGRFAGAAKAAAGASASGRSGGAPSSTGRPPAGPPPSSPSSPPSSLPGSPSSGSSARGPTDAESPRAPAREDGGVGGGKAAGTSAESGPDGPARPDEAWTPKARREAEAARADFHRALSGETGRPGGRAAGRSRALQAFFVANAGRGLVPSSENSGALSPRLRTEET
ncbi:type IV secretion system protein [Brevundimonas sp.]|uniref:type IV secretion system protein n=1 Tax=Brevundimonas sp. TaxID=1871086 RepID=UPI0028A97F9E|nr:type IV secretion system protein [Brevundimonas sp.]